MKIKEILDWINKNKERDKEKGIFIVDAQALKKFIKIKGVSQDD